jgi:hypothetical protein
MFSTWLKYVLNAGRDSLAGSSKKKLRVTTHLLSKHKEYLKVRKADKNSLKKIIDLKNTSIKNLMKAILPLKVKQLLKKFYYALGLERIK